MPKGARDAADSAADGPLFAANLLATGVMEDVLDSHLNAAEDRASLVRSTRRRLVGIAALR